MANSRSARKRIRANERKHERNRAVRSAVRTKITKARRALLEGDGAVDTTTQLTVAISALDRAAEKGVLHARNVARRKSRLMALANKLTAAASAGEDQQLVARAAAIGGEKGRKSSGGARPAAKPAAAKATGKTATAKPAAAKPAAAKPATAKAATAKPAAAKATAAPVKGAAGDAKPARASRAKKA